MSDTAYAIVAAVVVAGFVAAVWLTTPRGGDDRPTWHRRNR